MFTIAKYSLKFNTTSYLFLYFDCSDACRESLVA